MSQIDFAALLSRSKVPAAAGLLLWRASCSCLLPAGRLLSLELSSPTETSCSWKRAGIVLHTAPAVWAPKFFLPLAFSDLSCPFKHFTWTAARRSASTRAHLKLLGVCKQNPIFACLQIYHMSLMITAAVLATPMCSGQYTAHLRMCTV